MGNSKVSKLPCPKTIYIVKDTDNEFTTYFSKEELVKSFFDEALESNDGKTLVGEYTLKRTFLAKLDLIEAPTKE